MHTTEGKRFRFFHNGDFSGHVRVINKKSNETMEILFEDIKSLAAEYVRQEKISKLENCTDDGVLGL